MEVMAVNLLTACSITLILSFCCILIGFEYRWHSLISIGSFSFGYTLIIMIYNRVWED